MCQAGASNKCCSFFEMIGQGNNCKPVLNEPCFNPWCQAVVHLEVKMMLL